jgi:hypothetical protein
VETSHYLTMGIETEMRALEFNQSLLIQADHATQDMWEIDSIRTLINNLFMLVDDVTNKSSQLEVFLKCEIVDFNSAISLSFLSISLRAVLYSFTILSSTCFFSASRS